MRMGEREDEEEGKVTKWHSWERGVQQCSYKDILLTFCIQGFLGNRSMPICAFPNSPKRRAGPLFGLPRNCGPISHVFLCNLVLHTEYSLTSPQYHQGSVISTVQPLLWFFLHDLSNRCFLIYSRFPLVARGLHHQNDLVPYHTVDFLLVVVVSDPSTT